MALSSPTVSIGLPVYNGGHLLEGLIESVMGQTFADFEFIISDNASDDRTSELCNRLASSDPRVRYYRNDTNIGAVANHNRVIELATGEYFKLCGHDDTLEPTFIERCVEVLEADERQRNVLCFSLLDTIDADGVFVEVPTQSPVFSDETPQARLRSFWSAARMHQVIYGVIRLSALRNTELFGQWYGSDRQLLVELALLGGFARVEEVLFHHREHVGRSQYAPDKQIWTMARESPSTEFGYWRRLRRVIELVNRDYLSRGERLAVAGEYARYAAKRAPHWIPHLGRELVGAGLSRPGRGSRRAEGDS